MSKNKLRYIQVRTQAKFGSVGSMLLSMDPSMLSEGLTTRAVNLRQALKETPVDRAKVIRDLNELLAAGFQIATALNIDAVLEYQTWLEEDTSALADVEVV